MRVCFYTLGCKVNQNETGALAQLFEQNGFTVVEEKDGADVHLANSASLPNFADQKGAKCLPLPFFHISDPPKPRSARLAVSSCKKQQ